MSSWKKHVKRLPVRLELAMRRWREGLETEAPEQGNVQPNLLPQHLHCEANSSGMPICCRSGCLFSWGCHVDRRPSGVGVRSTDGCGRGSQGKMRRERARFTCLPGEDQNWQVAASRPREMVFVERQEGEVQER